MSSIRKDASGLAGSLAGKSTLAMPMSQASPARATSQGVSSKVQKRKVDLTEDERKKARELFDLYDYDKSNSINNTELQDLLGEMGIDLTADAVNSLLQKSATDATKITFEEFKIVYMEVISTMPAAIRKMNMKFPRLHQEDCFTNESLIRSVFRTYDTDKSGRLDKFEFVKLLWDLGIPDIHGDDYSSLTNEAFTICDLDQSDDIDFHEFVILINMIMNFIHKMTKSQGKFY